MATPSRAHAFPIFLFSACLDCRRAWIHHRFLPCQHRVTGCIYVVASVCRLKTTRVPTPTCLHQLDLRLSSSVVSSRRTRRSLALA
jgi:hypothetical protein